MARRCVEPVGASGVGWALAVALGAICTDDVIFTPATRAIYDTIARFSMKETITDL
jgi:hypothetical protein